MSVSVNQLTKIYGSQIAVNNVSFTVNKGEIVGFLGPNGAGKSTTMKILTGYIQANSGSAHLDEDEIRIDNVNTKKKIGYLPEHNPLYPEMYIKEYLQFVGSLYGLKKGDLKDRIEEIIEKVGLSPEKNKKIEQLSKGYRQRVGLAQALIHDPEVLILDEPTTGLDPNQLVEIRNLIKEVGKNKTIILSTHIMQEVEAICDRVIIINKGSIVADDKLEKLTKEQGSLEQIFRKLTNV
ncbi:MAG: ATP-binding cassette domain-containing protein [Cytophagaceae bacterium]|nr:ATP-binding cassette domain-containing protein [Cytophagaceae bacterium]MBK9511119.1 ATP-binding cassette domain-containing protein [Cytophagaceae bacterium]MBK9935255.1 ATP-binding cassette domain-containing protein [Cytophagaceae bacterium]MBL0301699.1 ATP-binding cassette domain-containing protein [Cytophagaceae bacterium]MBL0324522.1 ATP-binding cassette domain-containing protein [Cytophagaceae bacterium]